MKLVHIRVPGRNSAARLDAIRESYLDGELNECQHMITTIPIPDPTNFIIGARYAHPNKMADATIKNVADTADNIVRRGIKEGFDKATIVTDAQFVLVVTDGWGSRSSSDHREANVRANASWFDSRMWEVNTFWRFKSWCRPRIAIYDYGGHDGRLVWSWVLHFGPWWIIRKRFAL
jgi:hypothetical protein